MIMRKTAIVLGLIILIILVSGIVALRQEKGKEGKISAGEKGQIEAWIIENDLNQYGDPKDTVYMGGTPLFDEKIGKSIDRYEYILKNHPDRS